MARTKKWQRGGSAPPKIHYNLVKPNHVKIAYNTHIKKNKYETPKLTFVKGKTHPINSSTKQRINAGTEIRRTLVNTRNKGVEPVKPTYLNIAPVKPTYLNIAPKLSEGTKYLNIAPKPSEGTTYLNIAPKPKLPTYLNVSKSPSSSGINLSAMTKKQIANYLLKAGEERLNLEKKKPEYMSSNEIAAQIKYDQKSNAPNVNVKPNSQIEPQNTKQLSPEFLNYLKKNRNINPNINNPNTNSGYMSVAPKPPEYITVEKATRLAEDSGYIVPKAQPGNDYLTAEAITKPAPEYLEIRDNTKKAKNSGYMTTEDMVKSADPADPTYLAIENMTTNKQNSGYITAKKSTGPVYAVAKSTPEVYANTIENTKSLNNLKKILGEEGKKASHIGARALRINPEQYVNNGVQHLARKFEAGQYTKEGQLIAGTEKVLENLHNLFQNEIKKQQPTNSSLSRNQKVNIIKKLLNRVQEDTNVKKIININSAKQQKQQKIKNLSQKIININTRQSKSKTNKNIKFNNNEILDRDLLKKELNQLNPPSKTKPTSIITKQPSLTPEKLQYIRERQIGVNKFFEDYKEKNIFNNETKKILKNSNKKIIRTESLEKILIELKSKKNSNPQTISAIADLEKLLNPASPVSQVSPASTIPTSEPNLKNTQSITKEILNKATLNNINKIISNARTANPESNLTEYYERKKKLENAEYGYF
jgi:hypothetical protein